MNKEVYIQDLGLKDYKETWDFQEELFQDIVARKIKNRREGTDHKTQNHFLFVEHPHVYTLGKSGDKNNLLVDEEYLKAKGAKYYKINRGGDITYHGPGQIVGYPILDLDNFFTDIHKYPPAIGGDGNPYPGRIWVKRCAFPRRDGGMVRCWHPICP